MGNPVEISTRDGLAVVRIGREHGNAINDELVEGLITACQELESDPAVRGILLAASGKLFCPGLDLQELAPLERPALERFVGRFNACVLLMYTLSKPVVAALHGHALAGGCVLALTADWRVLRRGAKVGLAEIRVGVPFPFGVSMIIRESVPREHLEEVALFGWNYTDDGARDVGLVHEVREADGFEEHCLDRLRELAEKEPNAFAVTKRYLRSQTVERIRANDPQLIGEFLDGWFSPTTQERIQEIVAELGGRGSRS